MQNFEAFIFDLDGTIIDSMHVWEKIDTHFLEKRGISTPYDYVDIINSLNYRDSAIYTKEFFKLDESIEDIMNEWIELAIYEYSNTIKLKSNVINLLEKLKTNNIKIGLATASPCELYEPVLKNNGIYNFFDVFTTGTEVERGKKFPDIYLLTAKKLDVIPEKCIVFEDISKGIIGAKSAGMTAYGVYDKHSEYEKEKIIELADKYIYDFKEILQQFPIL